ncbi:hypothetical protein BCR41DRAFT_62533 [Lobosporangium transversale]|uniref:FYVE-type domain-containing protein n=1 Tax=Lobosporangium transversale TaxID=64571 RepID=A0A1Y2GM28_9FUNG|nr:hypothetical protein BCR41DRAFT_62533 [Lobosporangium transversale]ORZ15399.1 hypothetical protein BCR41DRAFT_62533 [Lobosporangium transversale]|eukprot:XP_021881147.1 hypothetical protein BCR41DRAFT_62533 [Lobosporangium transversale]
MAGNYIRRASLALRLDNGFTDVTQELARYRQAIQILLNGIKVDNDPTSKQSATALVSEYLQHAEELAEAAEQRNTIYSCSRQLETPRLATQSSAGNAGSVNEVRSLTLQRSRPSDMEPIEDLIDSHERLGHRNHSETSSDASFSSTTNILDVYSNVPEGIAEMHQEQDTLNDEHHRNHEENLGTGFSALQINSDHEASRSLVGNLTGVSADESSSTIPIAQSPQYHEVSTVPILSASPAATNTSSDSFPIGRLTRNHRSTTPSISSSRSNATESVSTQIPVTRIRSGPEPGNDFDTHSDLPRHFSSSFPTSSSFASQDRAPSSRVQSMQAPQHYYQQQYQHFSQQQYQLPPAQNPQFKWESDHKAIECRECHRKFSLWLRRHHCRRCGHVVCDRCSSHRSMMHPSEVVFDPSSSEAYLSHKASLQRNIPQSYRVCDSCYTILGSGRSTGAASSSGAGSGNFSSSSSSQQHYHRSHNGQYSTHSGISNPSQNDRSYGVYLPSSSGYAPDRSHPSSRSSSSSNLHPAPMVRSASSGSLMSECPVCGAILAGLEGGKAAQEAHVQDCLEGKSGPGNGPVRYIVYKLAADSPLIDQECAICFEEFVVEPLHG